MRYIANYDGSTGWGDTLEEAFDDLTNDYGVVDKAKVGFYEITPIFVEFKIVKKEKPVKVTR